ncbi:piggyBac transposable element-derived protein 3-like [Xyrichtys novacula]|uniref:PiggyBac transposable element-derived protein 3-like n=1 Tax=Xyrichtys novacula TaxID=13765 RepID=A0AAV1H6X5_XYRNO|nr:piggyBac transposable element-derived protein 3-like [Xyrichtys novacula]
MTLEYLGQCHPYAGKSATMMSDVGLGGSVVMGLLDCLPKDVRFQVTFDNYFTSLPLLKALAEKRIGATGTLRSNRLPHEDYPHEDPRIIKKKPRGSYTYHYSPYHKVVVTQWNDNNVVTIG